MKSTDLNWVLMVRAIGEKTITGPFRAEVFKFCRAPGVVEWRAVVSNADVYLYSGPCGSLAGGKAMANEFRAACTAASEGVPLQSKRQCVLCSGCETDSNFDYCRACGFVPPVSNETARAYLNRFPSANRNARGSAASDAAKGGAPAE